MKLASTAPKILTRPNLAKKKFIFIYFAKKLSPVRILKLCICPECIFEFYPNFLFNFLIKGSSLIKFSENYLIVSKIQLNFTHKNNFILFHSLIE